MLWLPGRSASLARRFAASSSTLAAGSLGWVPGDVDPESAESVDSELSEGSDVPEEFDFIEPSLDGDAEPGADSDGLGVPSDVGEADGDAGLPSVVSCSAVGRVPS